MTTALYQKRLDASKKLKIRILNLLARGMSQSDVARKIGVSRQRVYQVIQETTCEPA